MRVKRRPPWAAVIKVDPQTIDSSNEHVDDYQLQFQCRMVTELRALQMIIDKPQKERQALMQFWLQPLPRGGDQRNGESFQVRVGHGRPESEMSGDICEEVA